MGGVEFRQIDVFTARPFKGNPVAVVMDASGLTDEQMQSIASWTNLSETTFVLKPEDKNADYRVRIFTPGSELPFAGHPTIGTAYALLEAGVIHPTDGKIVQECGAGLVSLSVSATGSKGTFISFELPEPRITLLTPEQVDQLDSILGCVIDRSLTPALVDVGARWIVARTLDASRVLQTQPDYARLTEHDRNMGITGVCLYGEHRADNGMHIEVRSFAPACGVNEDPVCGSGNGSVAAFLRHHSVTLPPGGAVKSSQGQKLGREGEIGLTIGREKILVGGLAVTCIRGTIHY
ncbi:PhzF family phenazine biosynthesis protein [Pectobacterium aroidearum]